LAVNEANLDDITAMAAVARGEPEGLSRLYDRYHRLVFTLCLRILKDRGEAEDVLIEVFQELWERSARFDATRGSPLSYLSTLARSRAIDRLRSRGGKIRAASLDIEHAGQQAQSTGATPGESADLGEQCQRVTAALRALDPEYRQAVELSFYDGLSHSEIAAKLDKPLGTVKTYIRQGLIRLRDRLQSRTADAVSGANSSDE